MAAEIRVKRRPDEDPTETLILNCKKFKFEGSEHPKCTSTTFQLIGTIDDVEHRVGDGFSHSKGLTQLRKHSTMNCREELQKRRQNNNLKRNKYKVMSCDKSEDSRITLNVENETTAYFNSNSELCEYYVVDVYASVDDGNGNFVGDLMPSKEAECCSVEVIDCQDYVEDCTIESKYIVEFFEESYYEGSESSKSNNGLVEIVECMEEMTLNELPNPS